MKTIKLFTILFLFIIFRNVSSNIITVQVADFSFSPQVINIAVNDTVQWVWSSGGHTTTSVTIPSGAPTWDALIDNSHTSFNYVATVPGTYSYQCSIHASMGMNGTVNVSPIGIKNISSSVPDKFSLYQNYPNPFNPTTNFKFDIPVKTIVKLFIYDETGRIISELVNEKLSAGTYSVDWNASSYASGVYFYRLETSQYTVTKKLALLK